MRLAICDAEAFYPLRNLVSGPFTDLDDLVEVERFIRTVVLHDEIMMVLEPRPHNPEEEEVEPTEEELRDGGRIVIVAYGPSLAGYDFFTERSGPRNLPDIQLASKLLSTAAQFSNADEGNVYYKAHVDYLREIVGTIDRGGSALLSGEFGKAAINVSTEYPTRLFEKLDEDWQQFAQNAAAGDLGLRVPPVLSIVLTRAAKREAIPTILNELRAEWADASAKVANLMEALKVAKTVEEALEIKKELTAASEMFSPKEGQVDTGPVRTFWEIFAAAGAGAGTALLSGGRPSVGALIGGVAASVNKGVPLIRELGPALFGRGAFDLARRVRRELKLVDPSSLARLLTDKERASIGL